MIVNVQLRDEEAPKASLEANWFSASSVLRVYGQYLSLDKDHNGMLSPDELTRFAYYAILTPSESHNLHAPFLHSTFNLIYTNA